MEQQIGVIIVAGGGGSRMGGTLPKQFMLLGGMPILARTINNFAGALPGAEIVVVLPAAYVDFWRNLAARFDVAVHTVAEGGRERFDSVRNGLAALKSDPELIAVQDGVRPLATREMIRRTVAAAAEHGAAVPVVEPVDSFRETDSAANAANSGAVVTASHIVDRRRLRIVQTPQVFCAELLLQAYQAEYREEFTDDASVVEAMGHGIFLSEGERSNLKITTPEDVVIAEALLESREESK
ncbi:2-C-methyl-D-erythritol 4-phosphate cytidylyltransferase [uncultured Alistipes sp.]|jgi:2-C-methyl-D-erythritol 4-phosphate cytidylyltransferase|uniref:2-C-methyl-D-erythritol 4-phosphate cytidylyltransferase n=1 Tax=uncultured Alistipes sp. TaxID=538949 RepID=UPI0025EC57B4|nr:2-C-methyl-D-erythritol 4-phosphate cytidylyltransferase [uncultured Alistipes sp.]